MATVTNAQVNRLRDLFKHNQEDVFLTVDELVEEVLDTLGVHVDHGESGAGQTSPEPSKSKRTDRELIGNALRFYYERVTWNPGDTEREEYRRLIKEFS